MTVDEGPLRADGTNAFDVNVLIGGTLLGDGTVGATDVSIGGAVSAGASPGGLSTGDLNLAAGASLIVDVNGTAPVTQYD